MEGKQNPDLLTVDGAAVGQMDGCRKCRCSPTQFGGVALESLLASRRLASVTVGDWGARIGVGQSGDL